MAIRKKKLGYYVYYRDVNGRLRIRSLKTRDYETAKVRHDEFMRTLATTKATARTLAWHNNLLDAAKQMLEVSPTSKPPTQGDLFDTQIAARASTAVEEKKMPEASPAPEHHRRESKSDMPGTIVHKTSREINPGLRYKVLARDHFKCCACGASPAKDPAVVLHVDHIIPYSKGGETTLDNLQTLCSKCNLGKSDIL